MLKLAVDAGVPLIRATTDDVLNIEYVFGRVVGREIFEFNQKNRPFAKETVYYTTHTPADLSLANLRETYKAMNETGSVLVMFNLPHDVEAGVFFDAGVMATPAALILEDLEQFVDKDEAKALMPSMGGLTLREALEVTRLTQARDGAMTPAGVITTRIQCLRPVRGLELVNTHLPAYMPNQRLQEIVNDERGFFLNGKVERLRPRGLVAGGVPGTGKTEGAKYLAHGWGVPLFRLVTTFQSKYVGESEGHFSAALAQVEAEAPCVLLIDEVEKMMGGDDDSGVTGRVMAQFLWWLQEHRARVFTYMTYNNADTVPPELTRKGRIDWCLKFEGIGPEHAAHLGQFILATYDDHGTDPSKLVKMVKDELFKPAPATGLEGTKLTTHAEVADLVKRIVKRVLMKGVKT